jgi:hypothetical protein
VHQILCLNSLYDNAVDVKAVKFAAREGFFVGNQAATGLLRHKLNLIVVAVTVRDEYYVGGQVVAAAGIRVNVDNAPIVRGEPIAPVSLII